MKAHFVNWLTEFSIGVLEIRIRPPKGWSSSRIRKKAPATEQAETINARGAVGVGGASRLKLRKMATSKQTTTTSIGREMDETDSGTSKVRICASSIARLIASA